MNKLIISCFLLICLFSFSLAETIDFNNAQVLDAVEILAERAGYDLMISGDPGQLVNKRTTIHLKAVDAEEALFSTLKNNDLDYKINGRTIGLNFATGPEVQVGGNLAVYLKHLAAEKAVKLLGNLNAGVKVSPGSNSSLIVLQGKPNNLSEAAALLSALDQPVAQILIESQVVELSESDSLRLGLSYGQASGSFAANQSISTAINALIGQGRAKVVASPKIAALDGHEAVINIGSRIPYAVPVSSSSSATQWTVNYLDAGVKLKITPRLGASREVTADLQPEVSSVSEWRTTAAGEFPVITTRNAQSTVRVKDGESIVVGGLISETDRVNVTKMPILGYLPIIGFLFQNKTSEKAKTEIVFMITPRVI